MKYVRLLAAVLALGLGGRLASAQTVVEVYSPIVESTTSTIPAESVVSYSPVVEATAVQAWRPVTTYSQVATASPTYTTTYSPVVSYATPVTTYRPATTYAAPVTTYSPVITYSPVVNYAYSPAVAYSPVVTPVTAYYYPTAVVRSKVYYSGQPIRNFFRAITP